MFEVVNYIFFSSVSPLSFSFILVPYYKLLYSNEYCPSGFLFSFSLSPSLCLLSGYLSLSSTASSSMAWCIVVHIYYIGYVVVIVVRDVKGVDGEEEGERERNRKCTTLLKCICSFPYHHFVLSFFCVFFCHTNAYKRPRQNAYVLCR
jgi:hypothetical protein